jgi:hypothetical protein
MKRRFDTRKHKIMQWYLSRYLPPHVPITQCPQGGSWSYKTSEVTCTRQEELKSDEKVNHHMK